MIFAGLYAPQYEGCERASLAIKYPPRTRVSISRRRNASRLRPLGFQSLALSPPSKKGLIMGKTEDADVSI